MIEIAPSVGPKRSPRVGSTALAVAALSGLGMPWTEIDAILEADDRRLVRRYLQLHAERLEERLADQRSLLLSVEPILAAADPRLEGIAAGPDDGSYCTLITNREVAASGPTYDRCHAGIVPAGKGGTS